ncbi:MAG: serine/threonine protein kinase [Verrucomicrobiaceae bacterium]|nr:serine/threonine protein kinase [Verrucomicrobiaceae bacterium]
MSAPSTVLSDAAAAAVLEDVLVPLEDGSEQPGEMIGPYCLLEKLGEGGFGVVWRADQAKPVRREVALKLLKLGMDTRQVLARFEQERRVLASMEHPCIATIHDAGVAQDGRPYFVMELLRGSPLTTFCQQRRLPLRQRIELFRDICGAVQHAHQKGVIHRDLKPSNILVVEVDGRPLPKIIDFGIAKALTTDRLAAATLLTRSGFMLGTPEYMSPEQIADVGGVDTRSDVYALGVLLYELLTGAPPFDQKTHGSKTAAEFARLVREQPPKRPSTLLAARRSQPERALRPPDISRLPADLDWITLRALEKEPQRRYQSAADFAADLQRFLDGDPVSAHPPSLAYVTRRWIRRHQVAFAAACVCVLALVTGAGLALWQAHEARLAQARAESTALFLNGLLDEIAAEVRNGRNPEALRLALVSSQHRVESLANDPVLQIQLMTRVADLFEAMSDRRLALAARGQRATMTARHHGTASPEARAARMHWLLMMVDHGDRLEAARHLEALIREIEQHEGRGSTTWFDARHLLVRAWVKLRHGNNAVAVSTDTVAEARRAALPLRRMAFALVTHAEALQQARRFDEAVRVLAECRALGDEAMPPSEHELRLRQLESSRGNHARAAEMQRRHLERLRQDAATPSRLLLETLLDLCEIESRAGQHGQALEHAREVLEACGHGRAAPSPDTPGADTSREFIIKALDAASTALTALKRHDEALAAAHDALTIAEAQGNDSHLGRAILALARAEESAGHFDAAWDLFRRLHDHHQQHNASIRNRLEDLREMVRLRLRQKRPQDALEHARDAWRQTMADPSSAGDPEYLEYMAAIALNAWKAVLQADPAAPPPAELEAWQKAAKPQPSKM